MVLRYVVAAIVAFASAQPPIQTKPPSSSAKQQTITVHGCISGRTIVDLNAAGSADRGGDTRVGSSFRLKGSKAMLKELEAHNGHADEIVGLVALADNGTAQVIGEKKIGKGRVYAGKRSGNTGTREAQDAGEIELRSLAHLNDRCP